MPFGQAVKNIFAIALNRHIDNRCHTTPGCGPRTCFKSIRGKGAPERQLHMSVNVNPTRNHVFTCCINDTIATLFRRSEPARCSKGGDFFSINENIVGNHSRGRDDQSILD